MQQGGTIHSAFIRSKHENLTLLNVGSCTCSQAVANNSKRWRFCALIRNERTLTSQQINYSSELSLFFIGKNKRIKALCCQLATSKRSCLLPKISWPVSSWPASKENSTMQLIYCNIGFKCLLTVQIINFSSLLHIHFKFTCINLNMINWARIYHCGSKYVLKRLFR